MHKLSFVIISILFFASACASSQKGASAPQSGPCSTLEGDSYVTCIEKENKEYKRALFDKAGDDTASTPDGETEDVAQPKKTTKPVREIAPSDLFDPPAGRTDEPTKPGAFPPGAMMIRPKFRIEKAPNGNHGCQPGRNLSVHNDGDSTYVEVRGDNLRICGGSGIAQMWVSAKNGSVRLANVIPPGAIGTFYFLSKRDLHGHPVSTGATQRYDIDFYDADGGFQQSDPMPAQGVCRWETNLNLNKSTWKKVFVHDNTLNEKPGCRS